MTRILGLVGGEPTSALSGVAGFLFDALDRRFTAVERLDYSPSGAHRLAVAAGTFRTSRPAWVARFHTSRLAHRALSRTLRKRLEESDRDFDLALQVHGWVGGQPRPYALYIDQTRLMAERGWPDWMPFTRRERAELLAREQAMYQEAVQVFVMGAPARDSLTVDYDVDPRRISVVGGGLSFPGVPPARILPEAPEIVFVGRDFERKGGDVLLQAFAEVRRKLPAATLSVVGSSAGAGLHGVHSHGKVTSREELAEIYRGARVACVPSRYEPYGLALIEAMAHSVPCVGSAVQSIPEILDEGRAGVLVPSGDPTSLAAALLDLLTDDERAASLGAAGRLRVERELTWDRVADRMAPVIGQLVPPASGG